jgi:DNA-binding response OmpR family regulator
VILVADDDRDIRDLVSFRLQREGYRTVTAEDGVQALDGVRAETPDLVVLDVMMPGLSGLDVTAALRADARYASLPIILLTARVQESDVALGFDSGADDYMIKPFSPRELVSRVQAVLARTRT